MSNLKLSRCLLSVCLLTKNEENFIYKAVTSASAIADEIIVLDTGSTDKTKDVISGIIHESPPCRIRLYETAWNNDFSEARNKCISYATGEWLLFLDADEELANSRDIKNQLPLLTKETIYALPVINFQDFSGEKILNRQYGQRLFANNGSFEFDGALHERPVTKDRSSFEIKRLSFPEIFHYGYKDPVLKAERNISVIEAKLSVKTNDISEKINLLSLAIPEYLQLNQFEKAFLVLLQLEVILAELPQTVIYNLPLVHLAYTYFLMVSYNVRPELFETHIQKALVYFPDSPVLIEYLAHSLYRCGKYTECRAAWLLIQQLIDSKNCYPFYNFSQQTYLIKIKQALSFLQ